MAQIFNWNKQGFEDTYWRYFYKLRGCGASHAKVCKCPDTYVTYSRDFFETNALFTERAKKIVTKLQLPEWSSVLVVGCGLGYLLEELNKFKMHGYGFDNSIYMHSIKHKEKVKFNFANIDILSNNIVSDVNRAFKVVQFDCIVTEDVLTSHDTFEEIFSNCELLLKPEHPKSRIVHICQENATSPLTSKSMLQWQALNPDYTWLDQNGD